MYFVSIGRIITALNGSGEGCCKIVVTALTKQPYIKDEGSSIGVRSLDAC